jgi:hypothetical protein
MNKIFFHEKSDPGNNRHSNEEVQESIYPNHHELNITDGGEFLDDGTRMKEQPLETDDDDDPLEDVYE